MKKQTHIYFITGLFFLFGVTGCSLNNINGSNTRTTSKEDLMAARRILGESLSSDQSGIILSLNDALTAVSENGFIATNYQSKHNGRGNEIGYNHTYREKTGMHITNFKRQVQDALFSKVVRANLRYRYQTSSGTNIKLPQQYSKRIATIYYSGRREGKITTLHKKSHFVRQDTFLISGLNTSMLEIKGVHHGSGSIRITPANGPSFKRIYELEINFLDISASSAAFNNNSDFWKKVSGTLSWQLQINHGSDSKKMGGTIKLGGAGMALLNFQRSANNYRINLNNGDVKDTDEEFEGRVASMNIAAQSVTLLNGRTLYLTDTTDIEQEAYTSLKAVSNAINSGINIWTEGKGGIQDGRFIVAEIEFEKEDNEQDDDVENKVEFEDIVSSVDASAGVFTLFGKVTVAVDAATIIGGDSDYMNLQEVADALKNGLQVSAEGEAVSISGPKKADIIAKEVEFEKVKQNDNDDEED